MNLQELVSKLEDQFSVNELKDLFFKMDINYDDLPETTRKGKIRELVLYCKRHDKLHELVATCKSLRRNESWELTQPIIPSPTPPRSNFYWIIGAIIISLLVIGLIIFLPALSNPSHQKAFTYTNWKVTGLLALGGFIGAINDARDFISPTVTYLGTLLIVLSIVFSKSFGQYGLDWVLRDGTLIKIKSLSLGIILPFIGMLVLLWIPRLLPQRLEEPTQIAVMEPIIVITPTPIKVEGVPVEEGTFENEVEISQLQIGSSADNYRVELTIRNSSNFNVLIKRLELVGYQIISPRSACLASKPIVFEISDLFDAKGQVNDSDYNLMGKVIQGYSDYVYDIWGEMNSQCGLKTLTFSFDTAVIATSQQYLTIHIIIPRQLNIDITNAVTQDSAVIQRHLRISTDLMDYDLINLLAYTDLQPFPIHAEYKR